MLRFCRRRIAAESRNDTMNHGQGRPPGASNKHKSWRRLARIEKAALLTSKGVFNNDQIAAFIGIHPQTLVYLKQTPEFQARMLSLATGIIEQHDISIREDEEYQAQELKSMVPMAIQKLKELVLSSNQHIALRASADVLDREGTHAKVSRSAIDIKEQVNLSATAKVAETIRDLLAAAPKRPQPEAEQDEVSAEFTKGATDSTSQLYMMEEQINKDTLESLDVKKLKVN
jgi:hypothetical protein